MPFETKTETIKKTKATYVQKPVLPKKALAVVNDQIAWAQIMDYRNCGYIGIFGGIESVVCENEEADLKDVVDDLSKVCHVCYLGGLLFSKARVMDEVSLDGLASYVCEGEPIEMSAGEDAVKEPLKDVFDPWTLALCEAAFERDDVFTESIRDEILDEAASDLEDEDYDEFSDMLYDQGSSAAAYLGRLEDKAGLGLAYRPIDPSDAATCIAYNMRDNKATFNPDYYAPDALALLKKRQRTGVNKKSAHAA